MIIIVSERSDASTNAVLDWLRYYGTPYIIVYPDTPIVFHSIAIGNDSFVISIDGQVISADDLKYIWYRRGTLSMMADGNFNRLSQLLNNAEFYKFLHMEHEFVVSFFWKFNREKIFMNSYSDDFVNKLYVLFKANLHGLDTPESLVCAVKEKLIAFFEKHKEIIVKPIFNNPHIVIKEECFFSYNFLLTNQQLEALPDHFGISLFQQYIVKKYELRIFFIDNDYFSMAIFSQSNAKTRVDFRNYDFEQMNRYVPYNLPEPIKEKLGLLMGSLMLKSGSIDMIVSEDDKFYFLEVNPIGQFGMVSEPCNYYTERFIAQKLSS